PRRSPAASSHGSRRRRRCDRRSAARGWRWLFLRIAVQSLPQIPEVLILGRAVRWRAALSMAAALASIGSLVAREESTGAPIAKLIAAGKLPEAEQAARELLAALDAEGSEPSQTADVLEQLIRAVWKRSRKSPELDALI